MTTTITLTGTGVPHPAPGRAGAGVLVRCADLALQFDAGRATTLRLVEAGVPPSELTALFVTHVHSDHLTGLADVALTRWVMQQLHRTGPLQVVVAEGVAERFVQRMLEPYEDDIHVRREHTGAGHPQVAVSTFAVPAAPEVVWTSDDATVRVTAMQVRHEPVPEAVAYRVDTPDGAVVISGDTRVCHEVEQLCAGADVLVHEACRAEAMSAAIAGTVFERIFDYHADTVKLGAMAERASVPHLVLTHLIPQPKSSDDEERFVADVRRGGYTGQVSVGRDLMTVEIGSRHPLSADQPQ